MLSPLCVPMLFRLELECMLSFLQFKCKVSPFSYMFLSYIFFLEAWGFYFFPYMAEVTMQFWHVFPGILYTMMVLGKVW